MKQRDTIGDAICDWLAQNWLDLVVLSIATTLLVLLVSCASPSKPVAAALQPAASESPVLQSFALAKQVQTYALITPLATTNRPPKNTNVVIHLQPVDLYVYFHHPKTTLYANTKQIEASTNLRAWFTYTNWFILGGYATVRDYIDLVCIRKDRDLCFFRAVY